MEKKWDLFISHASEDKKSLVRPLAKEFLKTNLKVWYDEFVLEVGDSLRQSIDRGIRDSNFGVIILSRDFFKKNWPQKELNGLFSKEAISGQSVLIPIWHNIEVQEVFQYSPIMADVVAINSATKSIKEIAKEISQKVLKRPVTVDEALSKAGSFMHFSKFDRKRILLEIFYRIDMLSHYEEEAFDIPLWDDEWEKFVEEKDFVRQKYNLPDGLYELGEPWNKGDIKDMKGAIKKWLYRKNTDSEIQEFVDKLHYWHDVDMYYVLFGFPNNLNSAEVAKILNDAIFEAGRKNSEKSDPRPKPALLLR